MRRLRNFLGSPLARHPHLLARKIGARLHLYREDVPAPTAPVTQVVYSAAWKATLNSWTKSLSFHPGPFPFNRIFDQEFDESLLLRLCRDGPLQNGTGLETDIKLIWDYSRAHALFLNAVSSPGNVAGSVAFLRRWTEATSNTNGPAWTCAMDVAIRAVNWIFADVLHDRQLSRAFGEPEWAARLWQHGWIIWRRLEARVISSNHYLADLLGLLVVGSIFPGDASAQAWRRFAAEEFPKALLTQTHEDGGLDEASLRYHAFVTEMALLFRLALDQPLPDAAEKRLRAMCQIVADFQEESGDVFPFGDDDSGRVLALDGAAQGGRVTGLLHLASTVLSGKFTPAANAFYKQSGWWAQRAGDYTAALDFGGVGLRGVGAHAHNDDFSICLEWRGQPVIIDPGTFFYTGDPVARNRLRSTALHSTLMIGGAEQRPLGRELFLLNGRDQAWPATQTTEGGGVFTRAAGPVTHRREVCLRKDGLCLRDVIEGAGRHRLQWFFQLHPAVRAVAEPGGWRLDVPGAGTLRLESPGTALTLGLEPSSFSPGYSRLLPSHACSATAEFALPATVEWRVRAVE